MTSKERVKPDLAKVVRSKLVRYLTSGMAFRVFNQWLISATWDIDESSPANLRDLVFGIKLPLAEFTGGFWTEFELKKRLLPFATTIPTDNQPFERRTI